MPTNTYVALSTQTVAVATPSVTFTSIPQGYTDLVLVANYTTTVANLDVRLQVNGDTGANYSFTYLLGNGSSAGSGRGSNTTNIPAYFAVGTSTNGNTSIYQFQNYSNTVTNKTILQRMSSAEKELTANVGLYRSTSAITSVTLFTNTNNFAIGSTFTIYGIAAASVGAKATGGTIYQDADFFYHAFAGNGTFTPTQSLNADVLVVAGGGGGGTQYAGGGGAGGLSFQSARSLITTGYTVTVGAGGAGGLLNGGSGGSGTNGVNTVFDTITSNGGGGGGHWNSTGNNGLSGGSGGGGSMGTSNGNTTSGGAATQGNTGGATGFGRAGGGGLRSTLFLGGGGGGAGAIGAAATGANAGAGGTGVNAYATYLAATGFGVSGFIAGGGGGGAEGTGVTLGAGGSGGGGNGGLAGVSAAGISGVANTGSGGGGSGANASGGLGGNGGSGIVIVRYAK